MIHQIYLQDLYSSNLTITGLGLSSLELAGNLESISGALNMIALREMNLEPLLSLFNQEILLRKNQIENLFR